MNSTKNEKDTINRREFFYGVAGTTMVATLSQLGTPVLNAAQGGGAKSASRQAESPFFRNPPGADGNIHSSLLRHSLSAYGNMNAISQYAAPMSYELCGKTFVVMRDMKHKNGMAPGVVFSAYPELTVTLDGLKLPYCTAKITDELIFAAFHAGTEAYACVFDPSKSIAPDKVSKNAGAIAPGVFSTALYVDTAENPPRDGFAFNASPDAPNIEADFTGNVVEWTFAPETSAKFDYNVGGISFNTPGVMSPVSANFVRLETRSLADGVYFQGIQIETSDSPVWIIFAMNFYKVIAVGAAFGSMRGVPFMRPIGVYGKVLNTGEIKT
ncbi:MAG: hypothetical protein LBJ21_07815 [Acidobacteriota bacterium]|jgi:hypothetical protein|nr:hypothetical protein [Acidobacteriota bacterium]